MNTQTYGIAWDDRLKLGNEQVDAQHKRLFELLSELVGQCMEGSNTEKLRETLDFLVNYTIQHFYDEESIQVQYNFPEYKKHKQLHEDFKNVVAGLVQRFDESGSSEELSNDVNKVIVRWLISHIQREDKKIGEHISHVTARNSVYSPFQNWD